MPAGDSSSEMKEQRSAEVPGNRSGTALTDRQKGRDPDSLVPTPSGEILSRLNQERLAAALDQMKPKEAARELTKVSHAVEVLSNMEPRSAGGAMRKLGPTEVASLIKAEAGKPEDIAPLLTAVGEKQAAQILNGLKDNRFAATLLEELPQEKSAKLFPHLNSDIIAIVITDDVRNGTQISTDALATIGTKDAARVLMRIDVDTATTVIEMVSLENPGTASSIMADMNKIQKGPVEVVTPLTSPENAVTSLIEDVTPLEDPVISLSSIVKDVTPSTDLVDAVTVSVNPDTVEVVIPSTNPGDTVTSTTSPGEVVTARDIQIAVASVLEQRSPQEAAHMLLLTARENSQVAADLVEHMPRDTAAKILPHVESYMVVNISQHLSTQTIAEIYASMDKVGKIVDVIKYVDAQKAADMLPMMTVDKIVDVLKQVDVQKVVDILTTMDREQAREALLTFEPAKVIAIVEAGEPKDIAPLLVALHPENVTHILNGIRDIQVTTALLENMDQNFINKLMDHALHVGQAREIHRAYKQKEGNETVEKTSVVPGNVENTHTPLPEITPSPEAAQAATARALEQIRPKDAASMLSSIGEKDAQAAAGLLGNMSPETAAQVLSRIDTRVVVDMFQHLPAEKIAAICGEMGEMGKMASALKSMDIDKVADVLNEVSPKKLADVISQMNVLEMNRFERFAHDSKEKVVLLSTSYIIAAANLTLAALLSGSFPLDSFVISGVVTIAAAAALRPFKWKGETRLLQYPANAFVQTAIGQGATIAITFAYRALLHLYLGH